MLFTLTINKILVPFDQSCTTLNKNFIRFILSKSMDLISIDFEMFIDVDGV